MKKVLLYCVVVLLLLTQVSFAAADELEISDLDVYVNDARVSGINSGSAIMVAPGDTVVLDVELENTFRDDTAIRGIEIYASIKNLGRNVVFDESPRFSVNADDDTIKTVTLRIPELATEGQYSLEIDVEGRDENGDTQEASLFRTVEVMRQGSSLVFGKITHTQASCNSNVRFTIPINNFGTSTHTARLTIQQTELGINYAESLDVPPRINGTTVKTVSFELPRLLLKSDEYPILFILRNGGQNDIRELLLPVSCTPQGVTSINVAKGQEPIGAVSSGPAPAVPFRIIVIGVVAVFLIMFIAVGIALFAGDTPQQSSSQNTKREGQGKVRRKKYPKDPSYRAPNIDWDRL